MTPSQLDAALARNARWLRTKIKEGYTIMDIGIDPSRKSRSPFYQVEQQVLTNSGRSAIPLPGY